MEIDFSKTNDIDDEPLEFGKYGPTKNKPGKSPNQIAETDPAYIVWLYNTVEPKRCTKQLALACENLVDEGEAEGADKEDYDFWDTLADN